jgi:E3 ubiquitin-protein ligase HUWE1
MSRASDKFKDSAGGKATSVESLASDEEDRDNDNEADVDDNGREETPDLYRNSSLGMYVLISIICSIFPIMEYLSLGMEG